MKSTVIYIGLYTVIRTTPCFKIQFYLVVLVLYLAKSPTDRSRKKIARIALVHAAIDEGIGRHLLLKAKVYAKQPNVKNKSFVFVENVNLL